MVLGWQLASPQEDPPSVSVSVAHDVNACVFGTCPACLHVCPLRKQCYHLLYFSCSLTLASKLPSSSIMNQWMFELLVVDHLSKQASKSAACPGSRPWESDGDPHDMAGELRQRWAAQILISGSLRELVSLGLSAALRKSKSNWNDCTAKTENLAGFPVILWQTLLFLWQQKHWENRVVHQLHSDKQHIFYLLFRSAPVWQIPKDGLQGGWTIILWDFCPAENNRSV